MIDKIQLQHDQSVRIQLAARSARRTGQRWTLRPMGRGENRTGTMSMDCSISFSNNCILFIVLLLLFVCPLQEKGEVIFESNCQFKVDEFAFFIHWKAEGRVS